MKSFIVLASLVSELAGRGVGKMTPLSPQRYKEHLSSPLRVKKTNSEPNDT